MSISVYRITMPAGNIEESVKFYRTILDHGGDRVSPGRHYFDCDGIIVSIYDGPANGDTRAPRANEDFVYFAVEDIEATHQRARAAGAVLDQTDMPGVGVLGSVTTRPWGERSFYTRDPFGNPLCFAARDTLFTSGTLG